MSRKPKSQSVINFDIAVGGRILSVRTNKNLQPSKMADLLSCTLQHYLQLEKGESSATSYEIRILCDVLDITPNRLLGNTTFTNKKTPTEKTDLITQEFTRLYNKLSVKNRKILLAVARALAEG